MRTLLTLALPLAIFAAGSPARAQITEAPKTAFLPDPSKFASGLFAEAEIGATTFFGTIHDDVGPGFALGGRLGYDLLRWFALQAHVVTSTHDTHFEDSPQTGQLLQFYKLLGEAKLTVHLRQWSVFGEGGAGVARTSSNVLQSVMLNKARNSLAAGGGLGVDYHSLSRHFSVGLRADFYFLRDVARSDDLTTTTYLRYTF